MRFIYVYPVSVPQLIFHSPYPKPVIFFFWRVFSVVDWYFNTMSCWKLLSHRHLICFQPSTRDIFGRITWRCQMDIIAVREKRTWSRISGTTRACHFQTNLWRAQVTTPTPSWWREKHWGQTAWSWYLDNSFLPSSHLKRGHFAQFGFYALLRRAWPVSMRSDISLLTTSIRIISTGLGALHFHETTRSERVCIVALSAGSPGLLQPKTRGFPSQGFLTSPRFPSIEFRNARGLKSSHMGFWKTQENVENIKNAHFLPIN